MKPSPDPSSFHRFAHDAMATTFEVMIEARSREYAESAARAAFDEVDRIEGELSRFIPDSDIARVNALRAGLAVKVGLEAFECLQLAQAVWQETDGAFDVTVGGILPNRPPTQAAADRAPVGMHLLQLDATQRRVAVIETGVVVDLGAVGKGYAIDQAVEVLGDWGITRGFVQAGQSSVLALGHGPSDPEALSLAPPGGRGEERRRANPHDERGAALPLPPPAGRGEEALPLPPPGGRGEELRTRVCAEDADAASGAFSGGWWMPLRDPCNPRDPRDHDRVLGHVLLQNNSLSGSGRRLHGEHILDPRTREPCRRETVAAWAVADSAALSDAFSTAFMVMPPEQVEACCLRHPELSAILMLRSGERFSVRRFGSASSRIDLPANE